MRLVRHGLPLAAAVGLVSLAAAGAARAGGPGTYYVQPGQFDPADPATRAYFKLSAMPGTTLTKTVVVTSGGPTALKLIVYPVDGLTGQTSGAVYANRGAPRREAGRWLYVAHTLITLDPGKQVALAFSVRVPRGTLPGDHLAGIAVENAVPRTSGGQFRIREVFREVVGVLIHVPGPARPRLWLGKVGLADPPAARLDTITVQVANKGRLLCKPLLRVTLLGRKGVTRRLRRQLDTVLPGDTIAYPLLVPHVPTGSYKVYARASCPRSQAGLAVTVASDMPPGPTAWVRTLQRNLRTLRFYRGRITGLYGPPTIAAVTRFQAAAHLAPNGVWNDKSQAALRQLLGRHR